MRVILRLVILVLCLASSLLAAPDKPIAKSYPQQHRFYDRPGKILFGTALTVASADSAITCHNLANGGREFWQPAQTCSGNTLILFGGVAGQEAIAYLFHATNHHKLERLARFFTIEQSSRGIVYSARHHGL